MYKVSFDKGINFTFLDMKLRAGNYIIVVKNITAFESKYRLGLNIAGQIPEALTTPAKESGCSMPLAR